MRPAGRNALPVARFTQSGSYRVPEAIGGIWRTVSGDNANYVYSIAL
jgi:hypothetical protein